MPYLIETYQLNKDKTLRLVNIDNFLPFDTLEAANESVKTMYAEQNKDNQQLLGRYADRLESQVMDLDTDDRIVHQPKLYAYQFKAVLYSKRQIKNMC